MKNSKKLLSLALLLLFAVSLFGCGSSSDVAYYDGAYEASSPAMAGGFYSDNASSSYDYAMAAPAAMVEPSEAEEAGLGGGADVATGSQSRTDKIIYSSSVRLETLEFDRSLADIAALIEKYDGFVESSSVSGSDYSSISRGNKGVRRASYTLRIPSNNFSAVMSALPEIGNVPYSETYTENVTRQYYDVQSRLDAYRVQETRLLEMLAVAETVDDMLAIQRELTDVQYQIDSLTGTLRYYDDQVGYSTVNLTVQEVREYTPEPVVKLSYWERMKKGFAESLEGTGNFFLEFILWFITSLPWMIPLGIVIWLVVRFVRRRNERSGRAARRKARREEKKAERAARKAAGKGLPETPVEAPAEESMEEPKAE